MSRAHKAYPLAISEAINRNAARDIPQAVHIFCEDPPKKFWFSPARCRATSAYADTRKPLKQDGAMGQI